MVCGKPAERMEQRRRPRAFAVCLGKDVLPGVVQQRDVEMHAGAGIFLDRLGHEAGGDAVAARLRPHDALQHDRGRRPPASRPCGSAASVRTGPARIPRSPSRPECPAPSRPHRCRKTAAPCRADGRPNRPRSCRCGGRRARRAPAAPCRRRRARWPAGRTPARRRRPDAGPWPPAPRPAAPAHGAGRRSSARRRDDTSTSAPGRAAGLVPYSGTSVPGIGQARRSPSPESQISPVSWTSSPVMSRPRIEIGRCRPPS